MVLFFQEVSKWIVGARVHVDEDEAAPLSPRILNQCFKSYVYTLKSKKKKKTYFPKLCLCSLHPVAYLRSNRLQWCWPLQKSKLPVCQRKACHWGGKSAAERGRGATTSQRTVSSTDYRSPRRLLRTWPNLNKPLWISTCGWINMIYYISHIFKITEPFLSIHPQSLVRSWTLPPLRGWGDLSVVPVDRGLHPIWTGPSY